VGAPDIARSWPYAPKNPKSLEAPGVSVGKRNEGMSQKTYFYTIKNKGTTHILYGPWRTREEIDCKGKIIKIKATDRSAANKMARARL